ncbi:DNA-binding NarL/FixJ family response regulator [Sphingomonas sp. SORGH_AS802]|uniref:hypothetical protein n=1 Tax=unclassified Sphingomonas TaxID=196159 RepID=UPI0028567685|nr:MULTISPECIES: hypothetical protein [unclassified Sphingomonas]MDR6125915.1 DNA-binding NarL/FixJ family response regulator [Sphingomonas sp. SORGH_AS_0438]MDR6134522.1 DNA-binding NarL/FixJ family response regulator [Sphingomonas sp. SORGH_AS_0802]
MNDVPSPPHALVLLIDDAGFERDYVHGVLTARGIEVLGPFADSRAGFAAIGNVPPDAAVVAWSGPPADRQRLSDELARRAIPCLTIGDEPRPVVLDTHLPRPFAAFQVAEWVCVALSTRVIAN